MSRHRDSEHRSAVGVDPLLDALVLSHGKRGRPDLFHHNTDPPSAPTPKPKPVKPTRYNKQQRKQIAHEFVASRIARGV